VDTARAYGNEASVGRAVRDSGLPRDEVFVTSKLPAEIKTADGAMRATLAPLARKYGVTVPRLCVRYVLPLPKSTHPEFIAQNADVDFAIEPADTAWLDGLDTIVPVT
jgi:diketogulonate reductase-like aldo/keto reductase